MFRYGFFIALVAIFFVVGCEKTEKPKKVAGGTLKHIEMPENVFPVPGKAIAFEITSDSRRTFKPYNISISKLDTAKGDVVELFVVKSTSLAPVKSKRDGNTLIATLKSGSTYIAAIQPQGRLLEASKLLCPGVWIGRSSPPKICTQIYCPAIKARAETLGTSVPKELQGIEIGGWGENVTICGKCESFKWPGLIPLKACYESKDKAPPEEPAREDLIAFMSDRTGDWEVYTMHPDGTQLTNITNSPESHESYPNWSPSGDEIVFTSDPENGTFLWDMRLLLMDSEGNNWVELDAGKPIFNPKWSPDGNRIVYVGGYPPMLSVVERDSSEQWGIPRNLIPFTKYRVFSFDGNDHIVYDYCCPLKIARVNINSGVIQPYSDSGSISYSPAASSDGRITFVSQVDFSHDLFIRPSDGSGAIVNMTNFQNPVDSNTWSHDNKSIIFKKLGYASGDRLVLMNADTFLNSELSSTIGPLDAPWAPDYYGFQAKISWSPGNSRIVFALTTFELYIGNTGPEVYIVDVNSNTTINITNHTASDIYPDWRP